DCLQYQACVRDVDNRQISINAVNDSLSSERVSAALYDLRRAVTGDVIHRHVYAFGAHSQVHCATDGRDGIRLPGIPVSQVPRYGDLIGSQYRQIDVTAAHHGE